MSAYETSRDETRRAFGGCRVRVHQVRERTNERDGIGVADESTGLLASSARRRGCLRPASSRRRLLLDRQVQLKLRGQFVFRVEPITEVYASDAAVRVDLNPEGLDVVGAVRATREVAQVELDLIPALVESHGHRADEGLDARRALIV
jgi:hypothetical protein